MRLSSLKTMWFFVLLCSLLAVTGNASAFFFGRHSSQDENNQSVPDTAPIDGQAQIALLVPLQGQLGSSGEAIRNGFLAAYYYDKDQRPDVPTVNVIDTSTGNIADLYQQAVANGANLVIGPLTKEEVFTLARMGKLPVPTLALNTLDSDSGRVGNLYQFGLSPLDEAEQAADRARQEGHSRAILIVPAGSWGEGIGNAFARRFQSNGGMIVDAIAYSAPNSLPTAVRRILKVSAPPSKSTDSTPKSRFIPKPRDDFDLVFLVAFPSQAREIRPLLSFYNVQTPIYATSLVYSGIPSPQYDRDLNGIKFFDMPWILKPNAPRWSALRERITTLWPDSYNNSPRLYALGIDAYDLAGNLDRLNSGYRGATGILYLDSDNHVRRKLDWAQMRDGVPGLIQ